MAARIILEFPQAPEAKDLALLIALAEKFNAVVVELPEVFRAGKKLVSQKKQNGQVAAPSNGTKRPSLKLGVKKFPKNLDAYAVKPEQIEALAKLFEDEASAEVLIAMLRPLPIVYAQEPNVLALSGIWENRKISPDQADTFQDSLRQLAWGTRL